MKKSIRIILRVTAVLILVILLAAIIIPSLFKEEIKEKVVSMANEKINAELAVGDFGITLLRNFPNLTFRLKDVSITGVDRFKGDTLAGLKSFNLVFDISSVFSNSGYRIRSIDIDRPVVNAIILADGTANYDIVKDDGEPEPEEITMGEADEAEKVKKEISFMLNKFEINDGYISYADIQSDMGAEIRDLDMALSGNMSESMTRLLLTTNINGLDFGLGDIKYLKDAALSARFDIGADLKNNIFTLNDNFLAVNTLKLILDGSVQLDGEDILADLDIGTEDTDFKSLLSLVPAVFMTGFEELETEGSFSVSGKLKGRYSSADSILPDVMLELLVKDGSISYPDLPETINDIKLNTLITVDGTNLDNSIFDLADFHFKLAGNPFDIRMMLKTPITDPAINANFKGVLNLSALADAVPLELDELSGIIDVALILNGKMSMIENEDYNSFDASGSISLKNFQAAMDNMPPVDIETATFNFSPQYAALDQFRIGLAGNSISLNGRLENYLPFVFNEGTVRGRLNLYSDYIDLDTILSYMPADTTMEKEAADSLPVIFLPDNIDFEFIATIDRFKFSPLEARDLKGNIILRDGVLMIKETGLRSMGGQVTVNAQYDSRDTISPRLDSDLEIKGIGIKESFNTFNTVRKLAPVAEGMDGDMSVSFDFSALLGQGMMPLVESINGSGRLRSDEIQLLSSPIYEKLSTVLQMGEDYTNTFRDLDLGFEVDDGRVYIKPFNTRLGDMLLNISGDHGIDQTINYLLKLEVPSSRLPPGMSAVLTGMAARAAMLGIEYYQPEVIRMNVLIDGSMSDPRIKPSLGQSEGGSVGDAVKQTATNIVEDKVEEVKEKVSDEARRQADKILAEAAEAARKIRLEGDRNAQKLIDEAADKGALARLAADRAAEKLRKEADAKASDLEEAAQKQADKIMEEARAKAGELIK